MPAEWERHDAIWLSWPHDPTTFPDRVEKVEKTYGEIIKALLDSEKVNLLVKDSAMKKRAQGILKQCGVNPDNIVFHIYNCGCVVQGLRPDLSREQKERQPCHEPLDIQCMGRKIRNPDEGHPYP